MSAGRMDRRAFLRAGVAMVATAGAGAWVAGCSSGPTGGPSGAPPARGGTLRAAFVGGGATETLNHLTGPTALDYVRARARHGALGAIDPAAPDGVRYDLLDGIDVSGDLAEYTLRLRSGLRFTDGSPVTIRDVAYSLAAPGTLGALPFLKNVVTAFDLGATRVVNDTTAVLRARSPLVDGRLLLCQSNLVFKEGTREFTATMPTCGPFRMTGFEAGQGSTLVRHDGYVPVPGTDGPFLDGLELRSLPDSEARANALLGGQLDYADKLAPATVRTVEADGSVTVTSTEVPFVDQLSFSMNVRQAPFSDPRVREAVKYAVDRQQIVDTVFFGRAVVGNDLPSMGFPGYDGGIEQRPHDPGRARTLLSEAGAAGIPITLTTGPEIPGMAETATVVVENLKTVGLNATLRTLPPGQLFADFPSYTRQQFAGGYSPPQPLLTAYRSGRVAGAPSNFGFDRPDIDALVATGRSAPDPAARTAALNRAQRLIWAEGNSLIPVFRPAVSAQAPAVRGIVYAPFADFTGAAVR